MKWKRKTESQRKAFISKAHEYCNDDDDEKRELVSHIYAYKC